MIVLNGLVEDMLKWKANLRHSEASFEVMGTFLPKRLAELKIDLSILVASKRKQIAKRGNEHIQL